MLGRIQSVLHKLWVPALTLCVFLLLVANAAAIHSLLSLDIELLHPLQQIFQLAVWLSAAFLFNRVIDIFVWGGIVRHALGRRPPLLAMQLTGILVYLVAISGILKFVFGQPVTALWAASGAIGLVVGLALRNLIMDTFSGLAIHLERPFTVGDWINCHTRMGDYIGRVEETNWRSTRLWTSAKNMLIIPNSYLTNTLITNYSLPGSAAQFELDLVLDFTVPTQRALRVLSAAMVNTIGENGPIADPPPTVRAHGITEYGVKYRVDYCLDMSDVTPAKARNIIIEAVTEHLIQAGISLSYPRRDVFLARMPWRQKNWTYLKDQVRQLGRISLFTELSEADLEFIAREMTVHNFDDGTLVVKQGSEGSSMYILAEGLLEVLLEQDDGTQLKIADLAPGTFFGEKSLLTGEKRSATIICAADSVVCEITKSRISALLERNPALAETLSRSVVRRDLQNEATLTRASREEIDSRVSSAMGGFLSKMRGFFAIAG